MTFKRVHIEILISVTFNVLFVLWLKDQRTLCPVSNFLILKQVAPITEDVCLHLMGEPLAHPEFEKLVEISTAQSIFADNDQWFLINRYADLFFNSGADKADQLFFQAFKDNFSDRPISSFLDPIIDYTKTSLKKP